MEISLFCDELWLSNPGETCHEPKQCILESCPGNSVYNTKEDCEQASIISFEKELSYTPEPGYLEYLHSNNLMHLRHKAIQWLFKVSVIHPQKNIIIKKRNKPRGFISNFLLFLVFSLAVG